MQNLVDHVLEPTVGNYFRNSAQAYTVLDFLTARSERQAEAAAPALCLPGVFLHLPNHPPRGRSFPGQGAIARPRFFACPGNGFVPVLPFWRGHYCHFHKGLPRPLQP